MEQMRNQPSVLMCLCPPPLSTLIMLKGCQGPSFRVCNALHVSRNRNRRTSKPQARNFLPGLQSFSRGIFLLPVRRGNTNRDSNPLGLSTYKLVYPLFSLAIQLLYLPPVR